MLQQLLRHIFLCGIFCRHAGFLRDLGYHSNEEIESGKGRASRVALDPLAIGRTV
jgi:hypothetical protein